MKTRIRWAILLFAVFCFTSSGTAFASTDFTVTPKVIDGKGKVRDIMHYSVTVANTTKHLITIYPWVTDVDATSGSTGVTDLGGSREKPIEESLARWIEITRGSIDLLPGEEREVPVMLQLNLNAKPGLYHAAIHMSSGGDRATAEANAANTEDIAVNIEVLEDINERLELASFAPTTNFFSGTSASFEYTLSNIGNRGEIPRGKIRIYDRKGEEVASVEANQQGELLAPSAKSMLSAVWASGNGFGRYKAMLDLEYGSHGTLQDTVFFWVFPWTKLFGMFFALVVFCVVGAVFLHSYFAAQRRNAFAPAYERTAKRNIFKRFQSNDDDEEEDEEETSEEAYEEDVPPTRVASPVNAMRHVAVPHPVHTTTPRHQPVSLPHPLRSGSSAQPSARTTGNQVHLGKRQPPHVPPEHIVNLRSR